MNKSADTIITSILTWPHNVGVIILTALLWSFCCYFGYYSTNNFDMLPTIESYIAGLALVAILMGALGPAHWRKFIKFGVITELASIFALVASKSLVYTATAAGLWIFSPVSMFCFFMLIKNIWIESDRV